MNCIIIEDEPAAKSILKHLKLRHYYCSFGRKHFQTRNWQKFGQHSDLHWV